MYLVGSQAVLVMNMMMYSDKVDSKALNINAFEDACEEKLADTCIHACMHAHNNTHMCI